jgi:hypothetical protein
MQPRLHVDFDGLIALSADFIHTFSVHALRAESYRITRSARASTFGGILTILDFRFWILDCRKKNPAILSGFFYSRLFPDPKIGNPKSKII